VNISPTNQQLNEWYWRTLPHFLKLRFVSNFLWLAECVKDELKSLINNFGKSGGVVTSPHSI
jgi:hypothetical protein